MMQSNKIDISIRQELIEKLENEGKTLLLLADEKALLGIIAVADTIKPTAKEAIRRLHSPRFGSVANYWR